MSEAIDNLLYATLSADPTLQGLVNTLRIGQLEQGFLHPALQLRRVGGVPQNHLTDQSKLRNPNYQMDVYAARSSECYAIDDAVRAVLVPAPNPNGFTAVYEVEPTVEYEEDSNEYRLTTTLAVWWRG